MMTARKISARISHKAFHKHVSKTLWSMKILTSRYHFTDISLYTRMKKYHNNVDDDDVIKLLHFYKFSSLMEINKTIFGLNGEWEKMKLREIKVWWYSIFYTKKKEKMYLWMEKLIHCFSEDNVKMSNVVMKTDSDSVVTNGWRPWIL